MKSTGASGSTASRPYGCGPLPVDDHLPDGALAAARVTHHADLREVDLADEPGSEGAAPVVAHFCHRSRCFSSSSPRWRMPVSHLVAEDVDAVAADGHDDEPVAGQPLGDVVVAGVVGQRLPAGRARPAVGDAAPAVAAQVVAVQEQHDRIRPVGQIGRIVDVAGELDLAAEAGWLVRLVAEVVDGAGDGVRPGRRRRRGRGEGPGEAPAGATARSSRSPYLTVIRPVSTAGSVVTATTDRASAAGAPYPTRAPSASTL